MLVLALDTATPTLVAGVARWSPDGVQLLAERALPSGNRHAELLTPAVRASVGPGNEPSLALVRSLGFVAVGEQIDEVDGLEIVHERPPVLR